MCCRVLHNPKDLYPARTHVIKAQPDWTHLVKFEQYFDFISSITDRLMQHTVRTLFLLPLGIAHLLETNDIYGRQQKAQSERERETFLK